MKAQRDYPRFTVTAKGARWVEQGHPWIYAAEVLAEEGAAENGALADAVSEKGKYLGTGFVSRESKIRLRLVSAACSTPGTTARPSWERISPAAA